MSENEFLFEVVVLLGLAAIGLALFERLRLPAIAGFLAVGALAGPGVLGLVSDPDRVRALAEVGVIFLLFEIGLELPMERLRDLGRMALTAGGIQVGLTLAAVTLGGVLLGLPPASAAVVGAMVAMSSTALVMRTLGDDGQTDSPQGQLAVAVLVFQDLALVPLLLAIPLLAGIQNSQASGLLLLLGQMALGLAVVLFSVRFAVPWVLEKAARFRSPDLFSILSILIVLGSALLAEEVGLTLAVGAFLAGVAASASPYAQQLFSEVVPLRGVILGVFFTAIGMLFEPGVLIDFAPLVGLYLLTAILLKTGILVAASRFALGQPLRVGLFAGLALSQTGEFSFVLAQAASAAGLLSPTLYQVVIAGSILSLLVSPFILRAAPALAEAGARWLEPSQDTPLTETSDKKTVSSGRVILIGYGPAGQTLARILRAIEAPYLVIDSNPHSVRNARSQGEEIIFGDATRPALLQRLGIDSAHLVVVAISDPLATRRIVARIRLLVPDTPILARTRYVGEVDPLQEAGSTQVVAEEFEGSIELVSRALKLFAIPTGAIARFAEALREEGYGAIRTPAAFPLDPWLTEVLDEVDTQWVECPQGYRSDQSLAELDIRNHTGCNILAIERRGNSISNPDARSRLEAGDRLLVLGDANNLARLRAQLDELS